MTDGYILFDLPEGLEPVDRAFLEGLGHDVEICHGPPQGTLCPILTDEGCPLAEGAHGIIFELDLDRAQHRAILDRYKSSLRSDIPIRVVVRPDQTSRYRDLLAGLRTWAQPPVAGDLDAVAAEIESNER
jgi:hypothetical protein